MSKKAEAATGTVEPKELPPTSAIVEYSPTAAALADLAKRMAKVVYDVSTPKGMAIAKADRAEVRDLRVALEKKRVEIKEPALTRCREIDTEAKRITAELLKFEGPPDQAIKAHEAKIEAERRALIDAELKRVSDIADRIKELEGCQVLTPAAENERLAKERAAFEAEQTVERERQCVENERIAAAQRAAQEVIDKANRELEARQQAERETAAAKAWKEKEDADRSARESEERRVAAECEAEAQRIANYRPSFDEIVAFVAAKFGKTPDVVRTWICEPKAARKAA